MEWEIVMGLEVHTELATKTKIFCGCSTAFGSEPNTHVCEICSGMPGTLPLARGLRPTAKLRKKPNLTAKTIFTPICRKLIRFHSCICRFAATAILKSKAKTANPKRLVFTKSIWKRTPAPLRRAAFGNCLRAGFPLG